MQRKKYTVDFRNVKDQFEMHAILHDALDFPDYYGCNWDAFWDCITEPFGEAVLIEILGIEKLSQFGDAENVLLTLLRDAKHEIHGRAEEMRIEIVRGNARIEIDDIPLSE